MLIWISYIAFVDSVTCYVYDAMEYYGVLIVIMGIRDLFLYNKKLIKKYQYSSNYLGIPVDSTNDWCLYTTNNYISKVAIGGEKCYKMRTWRKKR